MYVLRIKKSNTQELKERQQLSGVGSCVCVEDQEQQHTVAKVEAAALPDIKKSSPGAVTCQLHCK